MFDFIKFLISMFVVGALLCGAGLANEAKGNDNTTDVYSKVTTEILIDTPAEISNYSKFDTLPMQNFNCSEEKDLWLILSSYEDVRINVLDLAFFLATHGIDATPKKSYVMVKFSDGSNAYLIPNGDAPRLADLRILSPDVPSIPI